MDQRISHVGCLIKKITSLRGLVLPILFLTMAPVVLAGGSDSTRARVGLVLSGGAARGFAHIGVLKVLEEEGIPIDVITGTSIGALIGGLYALGYTTDELDSMARNTDWEDLFIDDIGRRYMPMEDKRWDSRYVASLNLVDGSPTLPAGVIGGQKVSLFLSRLTWSAHHLREFRDFPIPFACVATDIATGEAVLLDTGQVAECLRASMAIPTVFTPVRIGSRLLVDGLIVRNLPAAEARRLGADLIIGVDVGSRLRSKQELGSLDAILDQSVSFQSVAGSTEQRSLCDVVITPEFGDMTISDFDEAAQMIKIGEDAARKSLPQLRAAAASVLNHRTSKRAVLLPRIDSIYVQQIGVEGAVRSSKRLIRTQLGILLPAWLTVRQLEEAVNRVYASGAYERVGYRLIPSDRGSKLIVQVVEKPGNQARFSFRYDSYLKSAILINATLRNVLSRGSVWRTEARLGSGFALLSHYTVLTELPPRLGMNLAVEYEEFTLGTFNRGHQIGITEGRALRGDVILGTIFSRDVLLGIGVRREWIHVDETLGTPLPSAISKDFHVLYGLFMVDTYDRTIFPRQGFQSAIRLDWASPAIASHAQYRRYEIVTSWCVPLGPRISWQNKVLIGGLQGADVPLGYRHALGGVGSFVGLEPRERVGNYVKMVQSGLQIEVGSRKYMTGVWNVGNTYSRWNSLSYMAHPIHGFGLSFGMNTLIGPIELTVMTGTLHQFLSHVSIGYRF